MSAKVEGRWLNVLTVLVSALVACLVLAWARSYAPPAMHSVSSKGTLYVIFSEAYLAELDADSEQFFVGRDGVLGGLRLSSVPVWRERVGFAHATGSAWAPRIDGGSNSAEFVLVGVPYWALLPPAALPLAWLLWRRRRLRRRRTQGRCLACGYDLRGSSGDRCPECGSVVAARGAQEVVA
jgi:hypothetical protein